MDKEILIPSEMIEPVLTKSLSDIFQMFGAGYINFNEMIQRMNALSTFCSNAGALHAELCLSNVTGKIMCFENKPAKLKKVFENVIKSHY